MSRTKLLQVTRLHGYSVLDRVPVP
ncbi:hypothetical protein A2U01_0115602, partial [Trifolium medium]|nr:hypothetical protein [Trifolium medium]